MSWRSDRGLSPSLAINPMGKVPAIKHGDVVVIEVAAICAYLADQFPEHDLAPAPAPAISNSKRGSYYRWLFFAAGPLEMAVTARSMKWEVQPEREVMVGFGNEARLFDVLEAALEEGPWICGERFTAADIYNRIPTALGADVWHYSAADSVRGLCGAAAGPSCRAACVQHRRLVDRKQGLACSPDALRQSVLCPGRMN